MTHGLPERYTDVAVLDERAGATLYVAHDMRHQRRVVIKAVRGEIAKSLELRNEFRIAAQLRHPYLVRAYELEPMADGCGFSMEFVDGVDALAWAERVAQGGGGAAATVSRMLRMLGKLATAIAHLHAHDLLHLDISTGNVLVDPSDAPRLLDFGQSCVADATAQQGGGTRMFAAPELGTRAPPGPAADWYAFGQLMSRSLASSGPGANLEPAVRAALPAAQAGELLALIERLTLAEPTARAGEQDVLATLGRLTSQRYPTRMPLVGRSHELSVLESAALQVERSRRPVLAAVVGEAGLGKTRLVSTFLARQRGAALHLRARCGEQAHDYDQVFDGLVDDFVGALRQISYRLAPRTLPASAFAVFPSLEVLATGAVDATPVAPSRFERLQAQSAVIEWMAEVAALLPIMIWIDDAHASTRESLQSFLRCLAALRTGRILAIVSTRPGTEAARLLDEQTALVVERIALGPLTDDREQASDVRAALHAANGVPFIAELALAGQRLEDAIDGLPRDARRLLELVGVGGPLPEPVYRQALGGTGLTGAIATLAHARLIVCYRGADDGDEILAVSHAMVGNAVLQRLPPATLRLHRASLAAAVRKLRPTPWATFLQLAQGQDKLPAAVLAAMQARQDGRYESAANIYRGVLQFAHAPFRQHNLWRRLGHALTHCGRGREAANAFEEAARVVPAASTAWRRDRIDAAECLFRAGYLQEGVAVFRELEVVDASFDDPPKLMADMQGWLQALEASGEPDSGGEWAPRRSPSNDATRALLIGGRALLPVDAIRGAHCLLRALQLAIESRDRPLAVEASALVLGGVLYTRVGTTPLATRLRGFVTSTDLPEAHLNLLRYADGQALLLTGDFAGARRWLEEASASLSAAGPEHAWERNAVHMGLLRTLEEAGHLREVESVSREAFEFAVATDDLHGILVANGYLAIEATLRDDSERALGYVARNDTLQAGGNFPLPACYDQRTTAIVALIDGDSARAQAALRRCEEVASAARLFVNPIVRCDLMTLRARVGLAALVRGDDDGALELVDKTLAELSTFATKYSYGPAAAAGCLLRANRDHIDGHDAEAARDLLEAADLFTRHGMQLAASFCAWAHAGVTGDGAGQSERHHELQAMGVVQPARYARYFAPAFAARG